MAIVFVQAWEESERGWGTRPDGFSIHRTREDVDKYVGEHWDSMPDGPAPDEYSRPIGAPVECEISDDIAARIEGHGLRFWARRAKV